LVRVAGCIVSPIRKRSLQIRAEMPDARKPEQNSHSSRVFRTPPMSSRLAAPGLAHTDFAANSVALFGPVKLSNIALRWLKPAPNLEET
jgi:hypothetical protein